MFLVFGWQTVGKRFCSELHFLDVWTGDVFYEEKLKMAQQAAQADAAGCLAGRKPLCEGE